MTDFSSLSLLWEKLLSAPFVTLTAVALGFFAFLMITAAAAFHLGKTVARLAFRDELKREREDAVKRSRAVLSGQAGEQVAPFLPRFPCNPADARFVGKPVDFVAFPGAARGDDIDEILFIEVKTGNAQLSARERHIKRAIAEGRVRYVEYRIDRPAPI